MKTKVKGVYTIFHRNRKCETCDQPYFRCNKVAMWTKRNPGKRSGWKKETHKTCLVCTPVQEANRILGIIQVRFEVRPKRQLKVA
mgnify:CR=1 FL=1